MVCPLQLTNLYRKSRSLLRAKRIRFCITHKMQSGILSRNQKSITANQENILAK